MKKLISLLAISFSISILTLNETSCFCFGGRKDKTEDKVDVSKDPDDYDLNLNQSIFDTIYNSLASQANINVSDIKNDGDISFQIYKGENNSGEEINATTEPIFDTQYAMYLDISTTDQYFNVYKSATPILLNVLTNTKINVSEDADSYVLDSATTIYDTVYNSLASQANVDSNIIKQDNEITVEIYEGNDSSDILIAENESPLPETDTQYAVYISVTSDDTYFNTHIPTEAIELNVLTIEKVDVSVEANSYMLDSAMPMYDTVYNSLASQANVDSETIENDGKITVEIYEGSDNTPGNLITDKNETPSANTQYALYITIEDDDTYFNTHTPTEAIELNVLTIEKVDVSVEANSYMLDSAIPMYDTVYNSLASQANVDSNIIKQDNEITVEIYEGSDNTPGNLITDKNETPSANTQYALYITIEDDDTYFNTHTPTEAIELNVLTIEKVDVSVEANSYMLDSAIPMYDTVYNSLASQANVDSNIIKQDNEITVEIYEGSDNTPGNLITDKNETPSANTQYALYITIEDNDTYFNTHTPTLILLDQIIDNRSDISDDKNKYRLNTMETFASAIYASLSFQSGVSIDLLESDNEITFSINGGDSSNEDKPAINTTYNLVINVSNDDQYFHEFNNTDNPIELNAIDTNSNKADITDLLIYDIEINNGATTSHVYYELYKMIADNVFSSDSLVSASDIENEITYGTMTVDIYNTSGSLVSSDSTNTAEEDGLIGNDTIKISTNSWNLYFDSDAETEYPWTVSV